MNLKNINKAQMNLKKINKVDPCESLPIFGIITSHFHYRKRESEERESKGKDEERLEREITKIGASHSKNYPKTPKEGP